MILKVDVLLFLLLNKLWFCMFPTFYCDFDTHLQISWKSIWFSFFNKPRTSMFKYHNKPGFAMKIVWHSTSKQKELKEKVIQTCKIFQLKVCHSKWSRSRYFKVERPRTKRCTTGQYEIGHKMLNQILGLLLFLGLILFAWFWKLMYFFFFLVSKLWACMFPTFNCDFDTHLQISYKIHLILFSR